MGFDDFRESDFSVVIPLLKEYGAHATFNRIAYETRMDQQDIEKIDCVIQSGNELGDHTWFHCNYIYTDPLCNGQQYEIREGDQLPFPANEMLRDEWIDGKNAFGFDLDVPVSRSADWVFVYGMDWSRFDVKWRELSDAQCREMRNMFSIYRDNSGKLDKLDELSNRYLGTSGSSRDSWSDEKQCYSGGIFSGCRTSANYEIWERITDITAAFYKDQYSDRLQLFTWSWPGDMRSPFQFTRDGKRRYYDPECTVPYNLLARFPLNSPERRSWTDCLRRRGYQIAHDTFFPSRGDGSPEVMMSKQLICNAAFSRKNALAYRRNQSSCAYEDIVRLPMKASERIRLSLMLRFPGLYTPSSSKKSCAALMYDAGGTFYTAIESMRHNIANGMVHGEMFDSLESGWFRSFLKGLLDYCRVTGVEVITEKQAYDLCFNQTLTDGNLIYNPDLRNTAREFLPDAEKVPNNPDGYYGDCRTETGDDRKVGLIINGKAVYLHYGIPLGEMEYSAVVKGKGKVSIYAIHNMDTTELREEDLKLLNSGNIASEDFEHLRLLITIPDYPATNDSDLCEGLGKKIMGVKIVYSGDIRVHNIVLRRTAVTEGL